MLDRIIYVSEYQPRKHYYALQEGEKVTLTIDWSAVSDAASSTVSSASWDTHDSDAVSVSGESLTDNKASALISADSYGTMALTNKATMADGQVRQVSIQIKVGVTGVNRG